MCSYKTQIKRFLVQKKNGTKLRISTIHTYNINKFIYATDPYVLFNIKRILHMHHIQAPSVQNR